MLGVRIISALIGIPVLIGIIYLGGYVLGLSLLVLAILGILEFRTFIDKLRGKEMMIPVIIGIIIFVLGALLQWSFWASLGIGFTLFLILTITVLNFPKYQLNDLALNLFALIYVGWTLTHLLLLRELDQGFLLVIFLFLIIWSSDTGAYFAGRFLGKNKLAPRVSPNKTIEGSLGGLVLSLLTAFIFNSFFPLFSGPLVLVLALVLSIAGQMGDLIESALKRVVDVKDSGNIIPGHGGILDRFDSTITTAPLLYYILLFLDKVG